MKCPKCNTNMRRVAQVGSGNSLDRDAQSGLYYGDSCHNCGYWIDAELETVTKKPKPASGWYPNGAMAAEIRAELLTRWDDIVDMRRLNIAVTTIKHTLDLPYSVSTIGKHIRALMVERGLPTSRVGIVAGPRRKQHKQEDIVFGRRAK